MDNFRKERNKALQKARQAKGKELQEKGKLVDGYLEKIRKLEDDAVGQRNLVEHQVHTIQRLESGISIITQELRAQAETIQILESIISEKTACEEEATRKLVASEREAKRKGVALGIKGDDTEKEIRMILNNLRLPESGALLSPYHVEKMVTAYPEAKKRRKIANFEDLESARQKYRRRKEFSKEVQDW